jgi:hypothetical protein
VFTLSGTLGATIEVQVVQTLNEVRKVWDPNGQFAQYKFERQPQTFPDVRLVGRPEDKEEVLFGIELKGWYLLSKEGEPSYRYQVTPAACTEWDLLVVVPWYLSNVLSGRPEVLPPAIESARYAAEMRNYWWRHIRESDLDRGIDSPSVVTPPPYPAGRVKVADKPKADKGGNFGRVSRIGDLDEYRTRLLDYDLGGIRARHWIEFFKLYSQSNTSAKIDKSLAAQRRRLLRKAEPADMPRATALLDELLSLLAANR